MRKFLKISHTLAACGLIGGLGGYMILLAVSPEVTPAQYLDLRRSIAAISNYLLLPSLAISVLSGLLAFVVHRPFMNMGWAWIKAAMGILMFKGVLTIIGAKADHAAALAGQIADGEPSTALLESAIAYEWYTLIVVMLLSIANVILGIWRPSRKKGRRRMPSAAKGVLTAEQAGR